MSETPWALSKHSFENLWYSASLRIDHGTPGLSCRRKTSPWSKAARIVVGPGYATRHSYNSTHLIYRESANQVSHESSPLRFRYKMVLTCTLTAWPSTAPDDKLLCSHLLVGLDVNMVIRRQGMNFILGKLDSVNSSLDRNSAGSNSTRRTNVKPLINVNSCVILPP